MSFFTKKESRSGLGLITFALPVVLFIFLSIQSETFLSLQNLTNINSQVTALLIASFGQMLVALTAGIDLSVGAVISLTSAILVTYDPAIAIVLAITAGTLVGIVNGVGITVFNVHPLVMTLAMMTFLQGLSLLICPVPGGDVPDILEFIVKSKIFGLPASIVWSVIAIGIVSFLLYSTRFGLRIFAIGANSESAALNGVPVILPKIICYVFCSLSGVLAGMYLTARVSTGDPTIGASFGLESVTAIALGGVQLSGGVGSVVGVVFGVLTLGLMTNGMNLIGISPFIRAAVTGILLLGAISLQRRKVIGV
ncbi:MAG: ABC transporter permease [Sneathiella sp.]